MNKETKVEAVTLRIPENVERVFSDVAEIQITEDNVAISFATRDRGKTANLNKARVSHIVYLSVPHFFRFVEIAQGLSEGFKRDIKDQIESKSKTKKKI